MPEFAPVRLCACAMFFWTACAQAPDAELDLAAHRVEVARTANAASFAPEPLHRAETALAAAQSLTSDGDYLDAVHSAGDAVMHADTAFTEATMAKRVVERDLDRCLRELEGLMAMAGARGAPEDSVAAFRARYDAVKAVAERGDLLAALEQGLQLKPELLAFEAHFRE